MNTYEPLSEAEILRRAEALRAETISSFFSALFSKNNKDRQSVPLHGVPAE